MAEAWEIVNELSEGIPIDHRVGFLRHDLHQKIREIIGDGDGDSDAVMWG